MKIRNRVRELRFVKASDLYANPRNWRTHPQAQQDALRGVLADIGYADALIARETPEGHLELIDGHLRAETTPETEVPVLIVDLDQDEANRLLTVLDPLAALAECNNDALESLLQEIQTDNAAVQAMLDGLAAEHHIRLDAGPEPAQLEGNAYAEQYGVIVIAESEAEQERIYNDLRGAGYTCRVVTT